MTVKTSTFAGQLQHFAQSIDMVDDGTFSAIRDLIYRYIKNELGAQYFELLRVEVGGDGNRQTWLRTLWSSEGKYNFWPVRSPGDSYSNSVVKAFDLGRPIWLVGADKSPLEQAEKYEDQWSHVTDLPRYQPSTEQLVRNVVIIPLSSRKGQALGACYMETSRYIEITDVAKAELRRLGDAIAILSELWDVNKTQTTCTAEAISDLSELLASTRFPKLAKPHFFVAFSNRADPAVIMVIREVLDQFSDRLEFTDWARMTESGNISVQISKEIAESRFGICYLSEPVDGSPDSYRDNPNVVFEAGMLHARTSASASASAEVNKGEPTGWIPIREEKSPPAPFDFATERILYVPRSRAGEPNEPRLREVLTKRVERLLGED